MYKNTFRIVFGDVFFWVILVLFLGIDVYSICEIAGKRNKEIEGHESVYEEFKGELSRDKIDRVIERYQSLSEIVADGDYSHEGGQPGTYTGYYAGDYGEFMELFEEYKYRYEYASYAEKIVSKPVAPDRIKESFSGRKLNSYYDMEGAKEWMEYDFHTLLCVLLVLFCACKIIVVDKKRGIYVLLETCSMGIRKVMAGKTGALVLLSLIIVSLFSVVNAVVFWIQYDMSGIREPLYAIPEYKNTLYNGSVLSYGLVQMLGVCISCAFLGIIAMFFAMLVKQELYAMLLGALVYLGFIALFFQCTYWGNPVGLLAGTNLIREMDLYGQTFLTVSASAFLSGGGLIWISGLYRVSVHS